jgi:hypothetical protein
MNKRHFCTRIAAGLGLLAATLGAAQAQPTDWPNKPVRWVVPFPPGGAMDAIARILGERAGKALGQTFVIENRPGAGGNIGAAAVAKAPAPASMKARDQQDGRPIPDGATVLIGGFGTAGIPNELIDGLIEQGARDLTVVNNNAGNGDTGLAALLAGRVRKIVCSFPAPGRLARLRRAVPQRARSSSSWCRRATWPSASAPPAPASARSSRPPATAPSWRTPGKEGRASSTAGPTCSSTRSTPTSR